MYHIQNIVCTCNIGSTLYLPGLVEALHVAEYNPKRFAAVTFRLRYPKTTALYFGSGKIVCAGAKTKNGARLALLYYVDLVRKRMGLDVGIYEYKVQNVVASASMPWGIDLERLYNFYNKESSYEPELFPGLIFRTAACPCVFLIFDSGRMVITGGKSEGDIRISYTTIVPLLEKCRTTAPRGDTDTGTMHKGALLVDPEVPWGKELSELLKDMD
jgi:transcription initiation factor TFIID TATA-box-binding protein